MAAASSAGPEIVLRLSGITKRFGPLVANDAISFDLARGEIVALLGENGAGKTTLMNILFGHYVADEGSIEVFGKHLPPGEPKAAIAAGIGMVHQHFTLADNLSVLDNIILGTESMRQPVSNRPAARRKIVDLSRTFGLSVDPDAPVNLLSVGERQRVEILKALYRDARILIMDEPTAVLTPQESAALFDTLRKLLDQGLSVIFISHKLYEVMQVMDRVLVLRGGKLIAARARAHTSREELAELMVGRQIAAPKLDPRSPGEPIVELRSIFVRAPPRLPLFDINLRLRKSEIVALAGVSGNGQTTLADLLSGLLSPHSGELLLAGQPVAGLNPHAAVSRGIGRIPEDRHYQGLIAGMTITENVIAERYRASSFSRFGILDWKTAQDFAELIIHQYEVKCPSASAPVELLSGGNMQKLILGRVLAGNPAVIIANQPTRGLDVGAVAYVHGQLIAARGRGAAILLISEDLDEIMSLADLIAVAYRGRISTLMPRSDVTIGSIGQMMAGQGFDIPDGERSHAA